MPTITVVLAMAHPIPRAGLAAALAAADDLEVVGQVTRPVEAGELAERLRPDVLLLDVVSATDAREALGVCRAFGADGTATEVLILAESPDPTIARDALAHGAAGVFDASQPLDLLVRAIRAVCAGEIWISRALVGPIMRELVRPPAASGPGAAAASSEPGTPALTARELEVLELMAEGLDHATIADQLYLSPHTARTHIRNVLRKLGAHTRLDAVVFAIDQGLVEPRGDAGPLDAESARTHEARPSST